MESFKMYIGGKFVDAASGKTYRETNPATGEEIAEVPLGDIADVNAAVAAARKAFPVWSEQPQAERCNVLIKMAEIQREMADEFTRLQVIDHGTPVTLGRIWSAQATTSVEFYAQAARAIMGSTPAPSPNMLNCVQRRPIGVAAIVIPWNSPLPMLTTKMGACIVTGNTCVIKPSSIDSIAIMKFAEILDKLGLPSGTVNIVTGPGSTVGGALAAHPDVDFISFTGSSETGRDIMKAASGNLKRTQMELGGKNPFIVLDDADVDKVVPIAVASIINNTGMVCASPGRFYIHESIHDEFAEKLVAALKKVKVGDPTDEATEMGPLISAEHRDRVEGFIRKGVEEGARLVLGGERPAAPPMDKGYFIMPTVFTDVKPGTTLFYEEIFGPVACLIKYSSEEDMIASANDNIYGLVANVHSSNVGRAYKVANRINAGGVGINGGRILTPETPWGGVKQSGFGKENSVYGLEEYTQLKVVAVGLD